MNEGYSIEYGADAETILNDLEKRFAEQIRRKIIMVAENVDSFQHYALTGNWSGYYRVRSGDYRAIYMLDHERRVVYVEEVGHRKDIYDE